jgi:hypothetical protein
MNSKVRLQYVNEEGDSGVAEITFGHLCFETSELSPDADAGEAFRICLQERLHDRIRTVKSETRLSESQIDLLMLCRQLRSQGFQGFVQDLSSDWYAFLPGLYFFEKDTFLGGGGDIYRFFVVWKGGIVDGAALFHDSNPGSKGSETSSLDPLMFEGPHEPVTVRAAKDDVAWSRYWYRKFYTETMTGQLMVLRGDNRSLFHYNGGGSTPESLRLYQQIRTLLIWIAAVLTLLALWQCHFVF